MTVLRLGGVACGVLVMAGGIVSMIASQNPRHPVVYASVGNTLRVFSLDSASGALQPRGGPQTVRAEIHYVAMHPSGRSLYLSATDRGETNLIYAFAVDGESGALTPLGDPFVLPSNLSRAVHITVDNTGRFLLMAHNVTETVAVMRLRSDGRLGEVVPQPEIPKLGYLVHQIRIDAANRFVLVPVRGNDAQTTTPDGKPVNVPEQMGFLHVFSFADGILNLRNSVKYASGIGPRHLDFHPKQPWVYVLTERGNLIITYRQNGGTLDELFRTTTLRDTSFEFPDQRSGAIHVHPNGRWVYVTNRNVAPCRSSMPCPDHMSKPFGRGENNLAVFAIDQRTGQPTLIQHVDSQGFEPRTFTIDPSGRFMIVGNMMNIARRAGGKLEDVQPNLSVFRIGDDGRLTFVRSYDQPDSGLIWWVGAY